jgi:hypothetical protein
VVGRGRLAEVGQEEAVPRHPLDGREQQRQQVLALALRQCGGVPQECVHLGVRLLQLNQRLRRLVVCDVGHQAHCQATAHISPHVGGSDKTHAQLAT